MLAVDAKYSDRDVRESPGLRRIATTYVRDYQGDFEFLVRAKVYLTSNGDLPTPTLRGVLNCMRADPNGAMLLPQTRTGRFEEDPRPPVDRPKMPIVLRVNVTWKKDYLLSMHALAKVAHRLDKERSVVQYFSATQNFNWWIYARCGKYFYNSGLVRMTDGPEGRRLCPQCEAKMG